MIIIAEICIMVIVIAIVITMIVLAVVYSAGPNTKTVSTNTRTFSNLKDLENHNKGRYGEFVVAKYLEQINRL